MIRVVTAIFLVTLLLSACTRDEPWHQQLTLVIATPNGAVSGSVV